MIDTKNTVRTLEGEGWNGSWATLESVGREQGSRADECNRQLYGVLQSLERWLESGSAADRQEIVDCAADFLRESGLAEGEQLPLFDGSEVIP